MPNFAWSYSISGMMKEHMKVAARFCIYLIIQIHFCKFILIFSSFSKSEKYRCDGFSLPQALKCFHNFSTLQNKDYKGENIGSLQFNKHNICLHKPSQSSKLFCI